MTGYPTTPLSYVCRYVASTRVSKSSATNDPLGTLCAWSQRSVNAASSAGTPPTERTKIGSLYFAPDFVIIEAHSASVHTCGVFPPIYPATASTFGGVPGG